MDRTNNIEKRKFMRFFPLHLFERRDKLKMCVDRFKKKNMLISAYTFIGQVKNMLT